VPISVFNSPSPWFKANRASGDDPKLSARVKAAWEMYAAKSGQFVNQGKDYPVILKRNGFQFWLRCKLTRWGVI